MKKITYVAANFVLSAAIFGGSAYAQNVVTDWGTIVQPTINATASLPGLQMVLRATVQIAVYDAVVAIEGGYRPFAAAIAAPPGADIRAAVATAAYLTARARVASSQFAVLDAAYQTYMANIPPGAAKNDGVSVGAAAASAVVALRFDDRMNAVVLYACSTNPAAPGEFEP